jgi:aminoglycoside phosphotransferase (APT) family kinase protein
MGVSDEFTEQNFFRETQCVNRARKVAHVLSSVLVEILPEIFSAPPRVSALANQGWMNLTLRVERADGYSAYILRLAAKADRSGIPSRSVSHFEKERYVLTLLQRFAWAPRLIEPATGTMKVSMPGEGDREFGYILQSYLPFRPGSAREVTRNREHVLEQLGAHVASIHTIRAAGYGTEFNERLGGFSFATHAEYVADRMRWVEDSPIESRMKEWLIRRLRSFMELNPEPLIYHRDLLANWGNVLVDGDANVQGIIDWEFAGAGAPLQHELASMIYALHRDGAPQEQITSDVAAVLRGYGLSQSAYREYYERDTESIVLLNSIAALMKFEVARRDGKLEREPWRTVFAERARTLCHRSFSQDATTGVRRRLAA